MVLQGNNDFFLRDTHFRFFLHLFGGFLGSRGILQIDVRLSNDSRLVLLTAGAASG